MTVPHSRPDGARLARAALTRLVEPGDELAVQAVAALGPERALALLTGQDRLQPAERDLLADHAGSGAALGRRWSAGLARWAPRAERLDPARDLVALHRLGGGLLIPEDDAWPAALDDLGAAAPLGLWFRGAGTVPVAARALAVVGSREATSYGRQVTSAVVSRAVRAGTCVVSGGAYGIDGAAHRAALDAAPGIRPGPADAGAPGPVPTIAVLAGGLDRFYPAGHEELLRAVMEAGLLLSVGRSPCRTSQARKVRAAATRRARVARARPSSRMAASHRRRSSVSTSANASADASSPAPAAWAAR